MRRPRTSSARLVAALAVLGLVAGVGAAPSPARAGGSAPARRADAMHGLTGPAAAARRLPPIGRRRLYVEPDTPARRQAAQWRATRPGDAAVMDRLAAVPQAVWLGDWTPDVARDAGNVTRSAAAAGAVPVLVAYDIPQRDCGGGSAGAATPDRYRAWIRALASGIGPRRALVILEPDALAGLDCLSAADRAARVAVLRDAVAVLGALRRTRVYLDAGNAPWHPAAEIAARLRAARVDRAAGFALNVSNFGTDDSEVAYGRAVSAGVGGRPFVVDTGRNGLGPLGGQWCNPPGRALGRRPRLAPGVAGLDGFLWVKQPGFSDGACNGGPPAGQWWPEEALGMARRAGW